MNDLLDLKLKRTRVGVLKTIIVPIIVSGLAWASLVVMANIGVWALAWDLWAPKILPALDLEVIVGHTINRPKPYTSVWAWLKDCPTEPDPLNNGQNLLTWPVCPQWKHTCGIPQVPAWNCLQCRHFSVIVLPLKVDPNGDVPSLNGCGDQMDLGELIDPDLELEELLDGSKLLLFLWLLEHKAKSFSLPEVTPRHSFTSEFLSSKC